MSEPTMALQELSTRGITTLEQFAASKARMRKPQRINSQKALEEILSRPPVVDPSLKSSIGQPASTVALVLDGKRVDYSAIGRLNGQPLDYVATRLKDGQQALVAYSDRSVIRNLRLRQFHGSVRAISDEADNALLAGGLQPALAAAASIELGVRIWTDHFFQGDSWTLAPDEYVPDLTEFDEGLGIFGGDWNDKISSIQLGRCWCQIWEHTNEQGASLSFFEDKPELDSMGWNDRISGIWAPFRG
jgi:hypothetical protein